MKFMLPTKLLLLSIVATLHLSSCKSIEKKEEPVEDFSFRLPLGLTPHVMSVDYNDTTYIIKVVVEKDSVFVSTGRREYKDWGNGYYFTYDNRLVYGRTDTGIIFIRKDKAIPVKVPDTVIKTKTDFIYQPIK